MIRNFKSFVKFVNESNMSYKDIINNLCEIILELEVQYQSSGMFSSYVPFDTEETLEHNISNVPEIIDIFKGDFINKNFKEIEKIAWKKYGRKINYHGDSIKVYVYKSNLKDERIIKELEDWEYEI